LYFQSYSFSNITSNTGDITTWISWTSESFYSEDPCLQIILMINYTEGKWLAYRSKDKLLWHTQKMLSLSFSFYLELLYFRAKNFLQKQNLCNMTFLQQHALCNMTSLQQLMLSVTFIFIWFDLNLLYVRTKAFLQEHALCMPCADSWFNMELYISLHEILSFQLMVHWILHSRKGV